MFNLSSLISPSCCSVSESFRWSIQKTLIRRREHSDMKLCMVAVILTTAFKPNLLAWSQWNKTTHSYKNSVSCVLIWTCCETELGCQLQRWPNNCMSTTQDMAHSFVDQAKLLSTNHARVFERNMAGIALQECRFEFPWLFFLEAISLSLWENETWKDLAGYLIINQIIIYLGLGTHTFINYQ